VSTSKLANEEFIKVTLKESTFKQFYKDTEFEESVNELLGALEGRSCTYHSVRTRKEFRRFL